MRIATALLMASVSISELALPVRADDQIRAVTYSPLKRTEIIGVVGQPTTITFPKTEAVYRVVQSGKADKDGTIADAGWQGASPADLKDTPLGNNLTLWPAAMGQSTMTVITKVIEGGEQRVYPFRLVALPDTAVSAEDPRITLNLIFQGAGVPVVGTPSARPTPSPAAVAAWRKRQSEFAVAKAKLNSDAFTGADGCQFVAKGKQPNPITPRCPLSNGEWTLMRFPGLSKMPAVYVVSGKDATEERLARQHAEGDFIVVEEIAPRFRLRLGDDVLDLINQGFDPVGHPGGAGTVAPTVARDLIAAKATR